MCVIFLLYYYFTKNYTYWSSRNIKHDKPILFFGTNFKNATGQASWTEISIELYNKYPNEKVVGYYRGRTPELHIRDPELIKDILIKDFLHFHPRGLSKNRETEPLFNNLFHGEGDTWKLLRQRLSPAFTSGKLKAMYPLIVKCAEALQNLAEDIAENNDEFDVRELMARFTTDFISACGFGIDSDSINNEQSLFRTLGRKMFTRTFKSLITVPLKEMFPLLASRLTVLNPDIEVTITKILELVRKQRNYKPSGRNDFVDLLLEMESMGKIRVESVEKRNPDGSPVIVEKEMDLSLMSAQLFVFFAAGFETSSSATSFTLHQLAFHQDIQSQVHEEIDRVLSKYNNKLSYDAVKEMTLLDRVFKEAMRIFPSLGVLNRDCARKYTIPGLNITIDPGVQIVIPINAIQNDEQYFENPKEFNPDRFLEENVKKRNKYVYLPFGEGPRMCIGM